MPLQRKTPLQRGGFIARKTRLRSVSSRRSAELRLYSKQRARFLGERTVCEVWLAINGWRQMLEGAYSGHGKIASAKHLFSEGAPRSCDVHHTRGRIGAMLLAEEYWMAVSREAHDRIHREPRWARECGFLG